MVAHTMGTHAHRKASGSATRYLIIAPRGQATRWRRGLGSPHSGAIRAPCGPAAWCPMHVHQRFDLTISQKIFLPATLCQAEQRKLPG